jgi:CRISPR-associated protein Cas2
VDILICYDVNTEDRDGRRRLRHVAKFCTAFGQRVQKSVFECRVEAAQLEVLRFKLRKTIDAKTDSIRIYTLRQPREDHVECFGRDEYTDFDDPMVL